MRGEGERTRKKERKGRKTLPGSLENRFNLIGHRLSWPFSCGVRTGGTILSLTEKTIDGLETSGERGVKNAVSLARRPDTRCFSPGYRRDRGHSRYVQQSHLKNSRNVLRRSSDPLGSSSGMHSHAPPRLSNVSAFRMTSVEKFLVERRVADSVFGVFRVHRSSLTDRVRGKCRKTERETFENVSFLLLEGEFRDRMHASVSRRVSIDLNLVFLKY